MKVRKAMLASLVFAILLAATFYVHVRWFPVDVVLYSAILDCFIAVGLAAMMLFWSGWFDGFTRFERSLLVVIWLLAGYAFAISIPTVIDRSLSFYILEKLQQRGGSIRLDRFEEVFTDEYLREHRLVDVRLTEQEQSGTIVIESGCVILSDRGRRMARFSRFFRRNFLPRNRLLMGRYSDDLTDPFRHSKESPGYECSPAR